MTTELDNNTLEWAAEWIEGSLKGESNERVIEFARNMTMTLRAAKTDSRVSVGGVVATVDQMWEALKAACCKNPAEAKLAVFVSEKKFKDALAPFAATASPAAPKEDTTT